MNRTFLRAYAKKLSELTKKRVTLKMAEAEVLRITGKVCRSLSYTYRFAYHDASDIEQQGYLETLEVLNSGKYDVNRPLENFLHVHLNKRLYNFKRDNSVRIEKPCQCCELRNPSNPCKKWLDWDERNTIKQNILQPLDLDNIEDESEPGMRHECVALEEAAAQELSEAIDTGLPVDLRGDYLKMMSGQAIPKNRRKYVQKAIQQLLIDGGHLNGEEEKWLISQNY